ncbi:MAG: T9SS C-terminal target domain-containing protein [Haliscomenobacteraceae bacterium CHB4]|nr:hypothetical protein [Saprospiraceae bacterium]MCE7922292.1 T9SS C-terminal target domain-containing protein [Haliscomenobacteraceae bacterium CHB4]
MIRSVLAFIFHLTFLATLFGESTTYYTVKFPDDKTVYGCAADPGPVDYPYITNNYNCGFNVGVSYTDQVFYTNSTGGCYKILRTWKLLYWCDYDPNWPSPYIIMNPPNTDVGPTVTANSYNHGYLQYTQIIKVIDTEDPYFPDCPTEPVTFCDYTNNDPNQYHNGSIDLCEGPVDLRVKVTDDCSQTDIKLTYRLFLDLDGNGSMETYVSSSDPNAWPIETTIDGGLLCGQIKFPPGFGLPYGTHKIEWIADDKCGNDAICKYEFIVADCKPPTVICYNGLSVNIMQTGMITLWDIDFIKEYFDNCSTNDHIRLGIRKAGTGTGFPADSHGITFDCSELGIQYVEVWANDESGAASYCLTYVDVQDNDGACPPSNKFTGTVATDNQVPVPGATVNLTKWSNTLLTVATDDEGKFEISPMTAGCNYKLTPVFDGPANAGVNTLDALLVAGQLDNIQALPTPYKLLAADVDKSGNLTYSDVMNIVKVAIGVQTDFPNNNTPAWQFLPQSYVFPNPLNPWAANVPSSMTFCLSGDINFDPDFVAIKSGDVNGSVNPSDFSAPTDDRSQDGSAVFQANDQIFLSGQEVRVDIITPDLANLAAFQFTLHYDPEVLSFVSVEPDLVPLDFFGQLPENRLTASWHNSIMLDPNILAKNLRLRAFTLVFNSLQKGLLSEVLEMNSSVAGAEAYTRGLQTLPATLEFIQNTASKDTPAFFSVRPNPVTDRFTATYYLPEAGETILRLTDAAGRVLQTVQSNGERGYNETEFDVNGAEPGLLFLRLDGPGGSDLQKVMKY